MFKLKTILLWLFFLSLNTVVTMASQEYSGKTLNCQIIPQYLNLSQNTNKFGINVVFKLQPHYHIYYKNPGDIGKPTTITWSKSPDYTINEKPWPKPKVFIDSGFKTIGYEDSVVFPYELILNSKPKPGSNLNIEANIAWLACKDSCIPGQTKLDISIPIEAISQANTNFNTSNEVKPDSLSNTTTNQNRLTPEKNDLLKILGFIGFAFIGGIILNFMPCVLPVVALKVLNFVEEAHNDKAIIRKQTIIFSSGIWSSFAILGLIIITLQNLGRNIGWGFQFQSPLFLVFMILLIVVLSLSLFGVFYIDIPVPTSALNKLSDKRGYTGTFFNGVLATCLSTPCTAPFLGSALGFAFSQPWYISFWVFMTIGLGMSLPYLLIAISPQLVKFIPKPGLWMDTLKQSMGFVMMFTAIWLISVLAMQIEVNQFINLLFFLNILSFVVFLKSKLVDLSTSHKKTVIVNTLAIFVTGLFFYFLVTPIFNAKTSLTQNNAYDKNSDTNKINYVNYTPDLLKELMASENILFFDFTAKWCLTCQANEKLVLDNQDVVKSFKDNNVKAIKFDWTTSNPDITDLLKKYDRSGVPLYVFYSPNDRLKPYILPEIITPDIIINTINQIKASKTTNNR